jgi:hypothetical protein
MLRSSRRVTLAKEGIEKGKVVYDYVLSQQAKSGVPIVFL